MEYNSDEFWEAYEERAAIMQFDGHLNKIEAEKAAYTDIVKQIESA